MMFWFSGLDDKSDTVVVSDEGNEEKDDCECETDEGTYKISALPFGFYFKERVPSIGKSVVLLALTRLICSYQFNYDYDFYDLKL